MEWKKIFAKYISEKELIARMYKEFLKLHTKKRTKDVNRHFPIDRDMANKHKKDAQHH